MGTNHTTLTGASTSVTQPRTWTADELKNRPIAVDAGNPATVVNVPQVGDQINADTVPCNCPIF